jgi:hypothetical protein
MRRRNLVIAAGAAAVLLAWLGWKVFGGGGSGDAKSEDEAAATAGDPSAPGAHRMRGGPGQGAPGQVSGTVLDAAERKPIPGVDVTFGNLLGESTATSGPDGRYTVTLAPGSYRVVAMAEGLLGAPGTRFDLRPGKSVDGYDILVTRLAALRGRVIDHGGGAVAGARVTFKARLGGKPIGSAETAPIGEATSDDGGGFTIEVPAGDVKLIAEAGDVRGQALVGGVVPGQEPPEVIIRLDAGSAAAGLVVDRARAPVAGAEVRITVLGADGPVSERTVTSDDAGRFRFDRLPRGKASLEARGPGGVSAPVVVRLLDGKERTGIQLVLAEAAVIAGRVVDGKGSPVQGAAVAATAAKSSLKPSPTTTDADGGFVLADLAAGTRHVVQARREGFAAAFARNVVPPVEGIELVLRSAGGIRGVVKGPGGTAVPSFQVQVERFVEADGMVRPGRAGSRFSAPDGRFELDLVEPGQYDLVVTADGFAPARPPRVTVPPDGWAEIEVELAGGSRVTGRVTSDGKPVVGARVAMFSGYGGPPVFTDAQGRFSLADVAPGRRSISASKSGMSSAHRDDLELRAGQTVDVELALGAGAGKEVGVGMLLARSSQARPLVSKVMTGGPAARAGVRKLDLVMAIDGVSTVDMAVDQATALLRGPAGSAVRVEVERDGRLLRFDMVRAADGSPTR